MFVDPLKKNEQILKYALIALAVTLVLVTLSALFFFDTETDNSNGQPKQEVSLTPEQELKLQEQIAPLIKAGDMAACDQVQNDMYKKVCINNIALNKAEETKDIAYCQHLDNELITRADCERQVVSILSLEREDISVCDTATDTNVRTQCRDNFAISLAMKKDDSAVCDQSANPAQCKDLFHLQQFMQDPTKVSCDSFSTPEAQADCAALKPLATETDPQKLAEFCQNKQSELFSQLCLMMGVNQMPLPVTPEAIQR